MTMQAPTIDQVRGAWDAIAAGFDEHTTPYSLAFGEQALRRLDLGPGTRVLDVAAGSGALAIPAARTGADVVAVDIAPTMIERLTARARAEGLDHIEGRVEDGAALSFDDDAFDAAVSMNGVTLFPDLDGGLRELVRVTRSGGQVLVVTFGALEQAEFIAFPVGALVATVPGVTPPPADPPMPPFRLADPQRLRTVLQDVGLQRVEVEPVTWEMAFDSAAHLMDMILSSNPIARQLTADVTDQQFDQVREVLDGMLRERSGGSPGAVLTARMNIGIGTA